MKIRSSCPACGSRNTDVFYRCDNVPVHSVVLMRTREEAMACERGQLAISFCDACGYIFNAAFDPESMNYAGDYESTQSFSPTYNTFAGDMAEELMQRHGLSGKTVVEIGCGQGEFLSLLCRDGINRGIGFDPAYREAPCDHHLTFVAEMLAEKHRCMRADFICTRMVMEHVDEPVRFLNLVRDALVDEKPVTFVTQVPDVRPLLHNLEFWNMYYEHCAYYSPLSMGRLLSRCGFAVTDMCTAYDGQYLLATAIAGADGGGGYDESQEEFADLRSAVDAFATRHRTYIDDWRERIRSVYEAGRKTVIWGSGSRAVAFLNTCVLGEEIDCVVDINPNKQGCFMPVTGQPIVGPDRLRETRPDVVILANGVYRKEVSEALKGLGVEAELLAL